MSKPKGHHVIPETYLNNFICEDGRISVFSKRRRNLLRPIPRKALTRYHYYSQQVEGIDNADQTIETTHFGEIETEHSRLYESLLSGTEKVDLKLLFSTLLNFRSRSPAFREPFELGLADMVERVRKTLPPIDLPYIPEEIRELVDKAVISIDPHRSLIAMAHYIKHYTQPIISMSYKVLQAPKNTYFMTSDNPVVWFERGQKLKMEIVYNNISTPKTHVVFPLDKKHVLIGRPRRRDEPEFRVGIEKSLVRS
jgi:hypothetical protein